MNYSDLSSKSVSELVELLLEFKTKYRELKLAHAMVTSNNPMELRDTRRAIARVMTCLNAKSSK